LFKAVDPRLLLGIAFRGAAVSDCMHFLRFCISFQRLKGGLLPVTLRVVCIPSPMVQEWQLSCSFVHILPWLLNSNGFCLPAFIHLQLSAAHRVSRQRLPGPCFAGG
jgi:hypothetical protein